MILELRGHDVREHGFRRQPAVDQPVRRRQLSGRLVLATGAAEHRALADDAQMARRNVMQPRRGLGAKDLSGAAAVATGGILGLEAVAEGRNILADFAAPLGAVALACRAGFSWALVLLP